MRSESNSVKAHKKSKISFLCRGNYYVKDLTDVLVEPHVSPSDFKYTKYMTTLVCIVPTGNEEDFKMNSDFITDYVVPLSARKLNVPEKDGLALWYFYAKRY